MQHSASFFSPFFLSFSDLEHDDSRQQISNATQILDDIAHDLSTDELGLYREERDLHSFLLHRKPGVVTREQIERIFYAVVANADRSEPTVEDIAIRISVIDNFILSVFAEFLHRFNETYMEIVYDLIFHLESAAAIDHIALAHEILTNGGESDGLHHFIDKIMSAMHVVAYMANQIEPIPVWRCFSDQEQEQSNQESGTLLRRIARRVLVGLCTGFRRFIMCPYAKP